MATEATTTPVPAPVREPWTYDDIPVCNCAGCGTELLGEIPPDREKDVRELAKRRTPSVPKKGVHTRTNGRPYCKHCVNLNKDLAEFCRW